MAVIKCDEIDPSVQESEVFTTTDTTSQDPQPAVIEEEVNLGKALIAVESENYIKHSVSNPVEKAQGFSSLITKNRVSGVADPFRAEFGKFWVCDEDDPNSRMTYLNRDLTMLNGADEEKWQRTFNDNVFSLQELVGSGQEILSTIGIPSQKQTFLIEGNDQIFDSDKVYGNEDGDTYWLALVNGGSPTFLFRPDSMFDLKTEFTDHAFKMNIPFTAEELEMFVNIDGVVQKANIQSDYDFYLKDYEETIAATTIKEASLPNLYSEVTKGDNWHQRLLLEEQALSYDIFIQWAKTLLADPEAMNEVAERFKNIVFLDTDTVPPGADPSIPASFLPKVSAFEVLLEYANRENLFPMNINIDMDTAATGEFMLAAEDLEMVDDLMNLLIGEGSIEANLPPETADVTEEEAAAQGLPEEGVPQESTSSGGMFNYDALDDLYRTWPSADPEDEEQDENRSWRMFANFKIDFGLNYGPFDKNGLKNKLKTEFRNTYYVKNPGAVDEYNGYTTNADHFAENVFDKVSDFIEKNDGLGSGKYSDIQYYHSLYFTQDNYSNPREPGDPTFGAYDTGTGIADTKTTTTVDKDFNTATIYLYYWD